MPSTPHRAMRAVHTVDDLPTSAFTQDQAKQIWVNAQDKTSDFFKSIPLVSVTQESGNLPTTGWAARQMRASSSGVDAGGTSNPTDAQVAFALTKGSIFYEEDNDTEFQVGDPNYLNNVLSGLEQQLANDVEDLGWNGDTTTDPGDADYDFLTINNGYVAQMVSGSNLVDGSAINGGDVAFEHFGALFDAVAAKYFNLNGTNLKDQIPKTTYRWVMGKNGYSAYVKHIAQRSDAVGTSAFAAVGGDPFAPYRVPIMVNSFFPATYLALMDPKFLALVMTRRGMKMLSTALGRANVRTDTKTTAMHVKFDFVLREALALAIANNMNA